MRPTLQMFRVASLASVLVLLPACARFGAVYPPRPADAPSTAASNPTPSRLVVHLSVTRDGLQKALDAAIPATGEGDLALLGGQRHYTWTREAVDVRVETGRLVLSAHVVARVALPLHVVELPLDLAVAAEPVMNGAYALKLQSVDVKVSSTDRRLELANAVGGAYDALGKQVRTAVERFAYDVRPTVLEASRRMAEGTRFAVGDAQACARVKLLDVEAGPTVLADGLEKDLALVISPDVALPCVTETRPEAPAESLPQLSNVAAIQPGPFTLSVPIAATYAELARAMSGLFTDGKLAFSAEYPGLYLEHPQLYESQGLLVLSLHLHGPVHAMGIDADLDGDIYFSGHLTLADNEVAIPDLEPTIETKSFFLSLKAATGTGAIRDQARRALRLDLGPRLAELRAGLERELTFGDKDACVHVRLDKLELASVYPHGTYVRVYTNVTGRAAATMPCAAP